MKRKPLIILLSIFSALIIGVGAWALGYLLRDILMPADTAMAVLIALVCVLIVAAVVSTVLFFKNKKQMENLKVEEINKYLLDRKESISSDFELALKSAKRVSAICLAAVIVLFLLPVAICFFTGLYGESIFFLTLLMVYTTFGFTNKFFDAITPLKLRKNDVLAEEEYPLIYAEARRAMQAVGVSGRVRIVTTDNYNASIVKSGRGYILFIGVALLCTHSEGELYNILLHEFAHVSEKYTGKSVRGFFMAFMKSDGDGASQGMGFLANTLLLYVTLRYSLELGFFEFLANEFIEVQADAVIKEKGNPQLAASSFAKLSLFDYYATHHEEFDGGYFFESETPTETFFTNIMNAYKSAVEKNGEAWLDELENEIKPRNATHPIYRERRNALGVDKSQVSINFPDDSTDFGKECFKALAADDKQIYEQNKEAYPTQRKNNYLDVLDFNEKWKADGSPLTPERVRGVIDAYAYIERHSEAEALCDTIIQSDADQNEKLHAKMVKAHYLLKRNDDDGITLMYEALDGNDNYLDECSEAIGSYCCRRGLQDKLDEYRTRVMQYAQRNKDGAAHLDTIKHGDNLSHHTVIRQVLDRHVAKMVELGEGHITEIYLIKKTVSDDYSAHVYFIGVERDLPQEKHAEIYNSIFYLLDAESEHYALFSLTDAYKRIAKGVDGSLVYKK